MSIDTQTTTTTLSMSATELRHLATIANYASKDEARPLLTYVRLTPNGDTCEAITTDSYVLARIIVDVKTSDHTNTTPIYVRAELLERAVKTFANSRTRATGTITITDDGHNTTVTSNNYPDTIGAPSMTDTYPDVDRLIPSARGISEVTTGVALNPHFLAKLAKLYPWNEDKTSGAIIRTITDATRPILSLIHI